MAIVEAVGFPGFYEIPGFPRYAISKHGAVLNKSLGKVVLGSINPKGYHNHRLMLHGSYALTIGKHRLMALAFLHPGGDVSNLVVNHKNGLKSNNSIENLEWVTYRENQEHAGLHGLTEKCTPISVRDVHTGEITTHPSATAFSKTCGLSKDTILWRLSQPENKVWPEGKQYRKGHGDSEWLVPTEDDINRGLLGHAKAVVVRHHDSGVERLFTRAFYAARYLGISNATISQWLSKTPGKIQKGNVSVSLAYSAM